VITRNLLSVKTDIKRCSNTFNISFRAGWQRELKTKNAQNAAFKIYSVYGSAEEKCSGLVLIDTPASVLKTS